MAILNDCKYGVSVDGGCIGLSLHKGGAAPDDKGDHGDHFCTYAFLPHVGGFSAQEMVYPAYALNDPPVLLTGRREMASLAAVDADNVLIETVKPCEDAQQAYVLRLYQAEGGSATARVTLSTPPRAV